MYTEVMLPLPIRWGSTYKIVKICHVTSLAKSAECNDIVSLQQSVGQILINFYKIT
jgi:hypothetical protein